MSDPQTTIFKNIRLAFMILGVVSITLAVIPWGLKANVWLFTSGGNFLFNYYDWVMKL